MDRMSPTLDPCPLTGSGKPRTLDLAIPALCHGIASDARLDDKAVRVACALLYWAQNSGRCTVSTETIAGFIRGSYDKVRDGLRHLEAVGYIRREAAPQTTANPSGRIIHLLWVSDPSIVPPPPARD